MGIVATNRMVTGDADAWAAAVRLDQIWAGTDGFQRRVEEAEQILYRWGRGKSGYTGVSWGKDSVVVADMSVRYLPRRPLVWVRVEPIFNPDCIAVRDDFLARYPDVAYDEIIIHCRIDDTGIPHATGTLERGFSHAAQRYGEAHISGIRRDESGHRERYFRVFAGETRNTLAPIIRWQGEDVFAYLAAHDLPVHPAYGLSLGGVMERSRLRVASLAGKRGREMGRREWEDLYYPEYRQWQ